MLRRLCAQHSYVAGENSQGFPVSVKRSNIDVGFASTHADGLPAAVYPSIN